MSGQLRQFRSLKPFSEFHGQSDDCTGGKAGHTDYSINPASTCHAIDNLFLNAHALTYIHTYMCVITVNAGTLVNQNLADYHCCRSLVRTSNEPISYLADTCRHSESRAFIYFLCRFRISKFPGRYAAEHTFVITKYVTCYVHQYLGGSMFDRFIKRSSLQPAIKAKYREKTKYYRFRFIG